jgi:hypothetical protein
LAITAAQCPRTNPAQAFARRRGRGLLATWATGVFYQAFVPALVEDQLRTNSSLVLGLVFAAYMAPSALGAPLGSRFAPAGAQRIGRRAFLVG